MDNALAWSKDNKKIERAIMDRGYDKDTTMNINFIKKQYTELDFTSCEITRIDEGLQELPNLTSLTLSQNDITLLENLPQTLEECILAENNLKDIRLNSPLPSMLYLNVSSNHLDINHLTIIGKFMPSLVALDLSFNYLTAVSAVVDCLQSLTSLKALWLAGNPCSLERRYRWKIADDIHSLDHIDNVRVSKNEDEDKIDRINDINDLMSMLYKEDRELAAKQESEKNTKKGPATKDSKAKATDDKAKKGTETPKQLKTMGSIEIVNDQLANFKSNPDIRSPFRIYFTVKVLEKIDCVIFEDLAEDPSKKKEDYMSSYWFEFEFSKIV